MSILDKIQTAITSQAAEKVFLLQKNSPKLLFAVGTVGIVGTVVLACRSTLKLPKILDDYESEIADMKSALDEDHGITQAEYDKAVRTERLHTFGKVLKLYAIPFGIGALSIGALAGSHVILTKQNATILASYTALEKGYQQYRERVREDAGEEKDREYANGKQVVQVDEILSDGSVKTTEKKIIGGHPDGLSPYAAFWGAETSKHFSRIPHENPLTIQMKQNWANDKLNARGFLFLNDAREFLGMEPVPEGQMVGWLRSDHPESGDGYVSFGVFDGDAEGASQFIDGRVMDITLDFNVDGMIWNKIGRRNPKL
jgi:hypothetical protein